MLVDEPSNENKWRGMFHKGATNYERTPACWIRPNDMRFHCPISTTSNWNTYDPAQGAEFVLNQWH